MDLRYSWFILARRLRWSHVSRLGNRKVITWEKSEFEMSDVHLIGRIGGRSGSRTRVCWER